MDGVIGRENDEALELFADLLEPASEILGDPAVAEALRGGGTLARAVKLAVKGHKAAVVEILARLDGEDPASYRVRPAALPGKLAALLAMPEMRDFFSWPGRSGACACSGSASESTGAPGA